MTVRILTGDAREMIHSIPDGSIQTCVTSPPYFQLRRYLGANDPVSEFEMGAEKTPAQFVENLVDVFGLIRPKMREDSTLWVNLGDSYAGSGKGPSGATGIGDQETRQGFLGSKQRTNAGSLTIGSHEQEYRGIPAKSLCLIPERFAIAMQDSGWIVRSRIAWCKKSAMPESVRDRPTSAWEHIWMFSKSARYFYDAEAVRQPLMPGSAARYAHDFKDKRTGHTKDLRVAGEAQPRGDAVPVRALEAPSGASLRNFWLLGPEPSNLAHYASYPTEIPKRCILAGSRKGDTVFDPFLGSGTTALVADRLDRHAIGIELNPEYADMARRRIEQDAGWLADVTTVAAPVHVQPPLLSPDQTDDDHGARRAG